MAEEKKYTLLESMFILPLSGIALAGVMLMIIPINLAFAWLRTHVWNWFFVPYLGFPRMSTWLMFAIMLFVSMFRSTSRSLKDDHYKTGMTATLVGAWFVESFMVAILWGVHTWILKGN